MPALARPPGRARGVPNYEVKHEHGGEFTRFLLLFVILLLIIRRHTYGETNVAAQILAWALSAAAVSDGALMLIDPTASDSLPG